MCFRNGILSALVFAMAAFAQDPVAADSPFQVRYATNLSAGESFINIGNTGASGTALNGPGYGVQTGNLCVNVYAVDPGEELVSCCSCLVTPDQMVHLGVNGDLLMNTANGATPTAIMVKLIETLAGPASTGTSCTQSAASAGGSAFPLAARGMVAFGTTLHAGSTSGTFVTTEAAFAPATLGAAELASLTGRCTAIIGDLSGTGICNSCKPGADTGPGTVTVASLTRTTVDMVFRHPIDSGGRCWTPLLLSAGL